MARRDERTILDAHCGYSLGVLGCIESINLRGFILVRNATVHRALA